MFLPAGAGLQVVIFSLIFFCHFARKRPHKSLYDLKLGMEHLLAVAKIMARSDLASEAIWRPKRPPNYFGSSSHNEFGSSSHNEFGSSSHNEQCKHHSGSDHSITPGVITASLRELSLLELSGVITLITPGVITPITLGVITPLPI